MIASALLVLVSRGKSVLNTGVGTYSEHVPMTFLLDARKTPYRSPSYSHNRKSENLDRLLLTSLSLTILVQGSPPFIQSKRSAKPVLTSYLHGDSEGRTFRSGRVLALQVAVQRCGPDQWGSDIGSPTNGDLACNN